ncbi:glycosyltransferase family 2 protein [Panacibacter sp. DH6]|uniref:Glycosyltransferase family 2 protein n=1 Tax=Panacibacter microcysteis TaxID=2793269 RepID=A0A931E821_9BACT|nr:glycosyltransferase family 2 protein [Panacibacter microcysteis]MBG9375436.1 glycosyltransferase family 2 protein [Panacibacter microcysteis]
MDMQQQALVSIIMATYNGEKFIEAQLDSIVHQTYTNTEIIILDDGSTDNTRQILQRYASLYKNIQLIFNDTNLGYIKNFEKGCSIAKAAYVSFCDQDDVWDLDKTTILMQALGNATLVYCDDFLVNEKLQSLNRKHSDLKNLSSFDNCLYFATDNCVGGHNMIIKKEALQKMLPFPPIMPHDLWCAFNACFYSGIQYVDQPLVKWRQHGHNITTSSKTDAEKLAETRKRIALFYETCPPQFLTEKTVLKKLMKSYEGYSLSNNFLRMRLFFTHKKYLLGMKKKSEFRKILFCLKMFFKMRLHVA